MRLAAGSVYVYGIDANSRLCCTNISDAATVKACGRRLARFFSTIGYILFIVAVRLRFENFGAMKAIYIYPGFLAFLTVFARESDRFYRWCENQTALRITCDTIMSSLLFLYVLTVVTLVGQLTFRVYN